jgi:hypothetical protein
MRFPLTTTINGYRLGSVGGYIPSSWMSNPGSECLHTYSPSQCGLGYDLSETETPNNQIESRWPLCLCQTDNESSHRRVKAEPESLPGKFSGLLSPPSRATQWLREKARQRHNPASVSLVTAPYTSPVQASRETVPPLWDCAQSPATAERSIRAFLAFPVNPWAGPLFYSLHCTVARAADGFRIKISVLSRSVI